MQDAWLGSRESPLKKYYQSWEVTWEEAGHDDLRQAQPCQQVPELDRSELAEFLEEMNLGWPGCAEYQEGWGKPATETDKDQITGALEPMARYDSF